MSPREIFALRDYLGPDLKGRTISDARRVVSLTDSSSANLPQRIASANCRARSVLLAVSDQLIIRSGDDRDRRCGAAHAAVSARSQCRSSAKPDGGCRYRCRRHRRSGAMGNASLKFVVPAGPPMRAVQHTRTERATEWLMLTSGTSGVPKIVGPYLEAIDRRDRRRWPGARRQPRSGRPSMTFAAMAAFRYSCAPSSAAVRWCCRARMRRWAIICRATAGARRHAYLGHSVALAQTADERGGLEILPPLCPPVGRDRRPGRCWMV